MTSHVLVLAIRLALGWYLMLAGWEKVQEELSGGLGTFYQSDSFQRRNPPWLPGIFAGGYGYVLPWAELMVGALVMAGLFGRVAAAGAAVIFTSIAVALYGAGDLLPRHHLMVFLPVALLLAHQGPGRYSMDAIVARRPTRRSGS
jgi:thiosulfate dehydrogenase [quinone] large subunit